MLGFLNCDDVCMRVFDESFELLEFVVYVNLQNDEISLVITARFMYACGVCSVCSRNCPSRVRIWNNPVNVLRLCAWVVQLQWVLQSLYLMLPGCLLRMEN